MAERQAAELQGVIDSELAALRAMMGSWRSGNRCGPQTPAESSSRSGLGAAGSLGMLLGRGAAWSA
jgi:hypothetical protein